MKLGFFPTVKADILLKVFPTVKADLPTVKADLLTVKADLPTVKAEGRRIALHKIALWRRFKGSLPTVKAEALQLQYIQYIQYIQRGLTPFFPCVCFQEKRRTP